MAEGRVSTVQTRKKLIARAVVAVGGMDAATGMGFAAARDNDEPLTGSVHDRATVAALEHVGEGTVTETEAGDDGAEYGVEVRLDDGSQVEVELDESFNVIGTEPDEDAGGGDGSGDD